MADKPPLVDQSSKAPMRKVKVAAYWAAGGSAVAGVLVRAIEAHYPILSGPDVNAFIMLTVPAVVIGIPAAVTGVITYVAGYRTRNRTSA